MCVLNLECVAAFKLEFLSLYQNRTSNLQLRFKMTRFKIREDSLLYIKHHQQKFRAAKNRNEKSIIWRSIFSYAYRSGPISNCQKENSIIDHLLIFWGIGRRRFSTHQYFCYRFVSKTVMFSKDHSTCTYTQQKQSFDFHCQC